MGLWCGRVGCILACYWKQQQSPCLVVSNQPALPGSMHGEGSYVNGWPVTVTHQTLEGSAKYESMEQGRGMSRTLRIKMVSNLVLFWLKDLDKEVQFIAFAKVLPKCNGSWWMENTSQSRTEQVGLFFFSIFSLHKTIWQFFVLMEFLPNFLVFVKWRAQVKGGWLDRNTSPVELLTATKLQSWRPLASRWALELSRQWSQGTDSPCSSWCQSKASSSRNCTSCHEPDEERSQNNHPSGSYSATVDWFTRQTLNCFEHLLSNL